jgi:hypothetical protein
VGDGKSDEDVRIIS